MGDSRADFLRHYVKVQTPLRSYLFSLLRRADDMEDVFQDVSLALWNQFGAYDPKYPFLNWAFGIARNQAARWRRGHSRTKAWLPPEVEEKLAATQVELEDELAGRRGSLRYCMEKLGAHARDILKLRYEDLWSLQKIAEARKMSLNAVNKALGKIRKFLGDCAGHAQMGDA
ncbi:MAG TPA: sigma-70 family RNA polymerase sigma factor [Planctomycetota bacterium]